MKKQITVLVCSLLCVVALIWVSCMRKESVPQPTNQSLTKNIAASSREGDPCRIIDCNNPDFWNIIANDPNTDLTIDDLERCCRDNCVETCFIPCEACEQWCDPCVDLTCREVKCLKMYDGPNGLPVLEPYPMGRAESSYEIIIKGPHSRLRVKGVGPGFEVPAFDPDTVEFTVNVTCKDGTTHSSHPRICPPDEPGDPGDPTQSDCNPCFAEIRIDNINGTSPYWAIAIVPVNQYSQPIGAGQLYGNCKNCIPKNVGESILLPMACHNGLAFDVFFLSQDDKGSADVTESWVDGTAEIYQNGIPTIDYGGHDNYGHFTKDFHQKCTVDRCER